MKQNDGRIIWKNQSDLKLILTINEFIENMELNLVVNTRRNYQKIQILHQVCGLLIKNMDHGRIC